MLAWPAPQMGSVLELSHKASTLHRDHRGGAATGPLDDALGEG